MTGRRRSGEHRCSRAWRLPEPAATEPAGNSLNSSKARSGQVCSPPTASVHLVTMSSASSFDPEIIDQTRQQLRSLVHEIEGLSRSEVSPGEFYEGFLTRVVTALAAVGGAVWTVEERGRSAALLPHESPAGAARRNEDDQQRHGRLLHKVATDGQGILVQPHSGDGENGEAGESDGIPARARRAQERSASARGRRDFSASRRTADRRARLSAVSHADVRSGRRLSQDPPPAVVRRSADHVVAARAVHAARA